MVPNILGQLATSTREILALATQHGAYNVRVFGSVARGEQGPNSDVDFLVDMEPGRTLLDVGELLMDLRDLLGCDVDVVTSGGLRGALRERILQDAVLLQDLAA